MIDEFNIYTPHPQVCSGAWSLYIPLTDDYC